MDSIIKIKNISMKFNLEKEKTDTIKEYILNFSKRNKNYDEFFALKNISLDVLRGESLAIIGVNGSGKSTLLKIIAGVMYPSCGEIIVNGSIAPLIELGAGFDMDLTARENIYLNGAVLGHDRTFMNKYFEDIIEFSELKDFIDVPVKNFSSGMVARLGFAIATVVKADILIVDEVLAVGDAKFQEKCRNRIKKLMSGGTTLLFVSHSNELVQELCNRAVWLEQGKIMMVGDCKDVCTEYAKR